MRQVVLLRGHLMDQRRWQHVLDVRAATGISLVVVWHGPRPDRPATLMGEVPYDVVDRIEPALEAVRLPAPPPELPPVVAVDPLPRLSICDFGRFRAKACRLLTDEEFARVDALYSHGLAQACTWLCEHPNYQQRRPPEPTDLIDHRLREVLLPFLDRDTVSGTVAFLESQYGAGHLRELV